MSTELMLVPAFIFSIIAYSSTGFKSLINVLWDSEHRMILRCGSYPVSYWYIFLKWLGIIMVSSTCRVLIPYSLEYSWIHTDFFNVCYSIIIVFTNNQLIEQHILYTFYWKHSVEFFVQGRQLALLSHYPTTN